jgi:hypothetical protein
VAFFLGLPAIEWVTSPPDSPIPTIPRKNEGSQRSSQGGGRRHDLDGEQTTENHLKYGNERSYF